MTIEQGISIISTRDPELNGTYALDRERASLFATYIVLHGRFPTGLSTMQWADVDGKPHTFTSPQQFMAFASAVVDILEALKAGNTPAQSASIP